MVGDKACDFDSHDKHVRERFGTELVPLHRKCRVKPRYRTAGNCGVTNAGGRLSDAMPGCRATNGSSPGMNGTSQTTHGTARLHSYFIEALVKVGFFGWF